MSYINIGYRNNNDIKNKLINESIVDYNYIAAGMLSNAILGGGFTFRIKENKLSKEQEERAKEILNRFINLNQLDTMNIELMRRVLMNGASVLTFRPFENSYVIEYNETE
jgi:hypothetical protein